MSENNRLFIVMGIHRSGTSATAGALFQLGVNMGDSLVEGDYSNEKGHFENVRFMELNDRILAYAGGSWHTPPTRSTMQSLTFPPEPLQAFLNSARKPIWGLKDPRFVITYDVWKPFIGLMEQVTYVFVHRPFQASVSSLQKRNNFSESEAVKILTKYRQNLDLYRRELEASHADIIDVNYDDFLRDPLFFVSEINRRLNRKHDYGLNSVWGFLDTTLKHF